MSNKENTDMTSLPLNTFDDIPKPNADAKHITGLTKHKGKITGYQLSDGAIVSKQEGISMARNGEIAGVGIAHKGETEYLKSLPDDTENNNLGNLPTVSVDKFS